MPTRRQFLRYAALTGTTFAMPALPRKAAAGVAVNDIHSQLNASEVDRIIAVDSEATLRSAITAARTQGKPIPDCCTVAAVKVSARPVIPASKNRAGDRR